MSDIDDLLMEFSAPQEKQGVARYVPDPSEFGSAYDDATSSSFGKLTEAGRNIWDQGANPWNVSSAALAGLEYLSSPFTAFGRYLGGPVERGIGDATGSPQLGKVLGDTVALAPALAVPFPGASAIRAAPEAVGMVAGEYGGAKMATDAMLGQASRAAGAVGDKVDSMLGRAAKKPVVDDLESLVDEVASKTRQTSRAKTVEEETALKWYNDQFKGGGDNLDLPPTSLPGSQDIRTLHKPNPKVGEKTYSGNVIPYQPQGTRPTLRTSALPAQPTRDYSPVWDDGGYPTTNLGTMENATPAPMEPYDNAFRRQFEPGAVELGSPPSQMPLRPWQNPALEGMHLPAARDNVQPDPNLLAELKLKFGMGSPQTGEVPAFMRPPEPPGSAPIPGAQPMPKTTGTSEVIPDRAVAPAQAPKAVTQYGDVEVGQPYDIVANMGGQEMRAAGGVVKELTYKNENVVEKGKSVMRAVGYATLEDGRQVPVKLLQRSGTTSPKLDPPMGSIEAVKKSLKERASTETADTTPDPGFARLQEAMGKKGSKPPVVSKPKSAWTKGDDIEDDLLEEEYPAMADARAWNEWMSKNHKDTWSEYWKQRDAKKIDPELQLKVDELENEFFGTQTKPSADSPWKKTTPDGKQVDYNAGVRSDVITVIKKTLSAQKGKLKFSELADKLPGLTRSSFDKAVTEMMSTTTPNLTKSKAKDGDIVLLRTKMTEEQQKAMSRASGAQQKDANFNKGFEAVKKNLKGSATYLHNFSGMNMANVGAEIKNSEIAKRFNKMIEAGEAKVFTENTRKPVTRVTENMFDPDELDEDLVIEFAKKPKAGMEPAKAPVKAKKPKADK